MKGESLNWGGLLNFTSTTVGLDNNTLNLSREELYLLEKKNSVDVYKFIDH